MRFLCFLTDKLRALEPTKIPTHTHTKINVIFCRFLVSYRGNNRELYDVPIVHLGYNSVSVY